MLLPLRLGPVTISVAGYRGPAFEPLVNAAASGDDLAPALLSITEQFGFEGFAHGFVLRLRPEAEGEVFLFSTYSIEWMREYDQRAYVEVDPRVKACASTALPVIWDQSTFRGQSRIVDAFLDAALANGIGSGVSIGTRDSFGHASMTSLNSPIRITDKKRLLEIVQNLGETVLFAQCFHEIFSAAIAQHRLTPVLRGASLSARENQCLVMAGRGLTSQDIADKLLISPRTVQFHFDSIRSKLGAANRQEAIAKARRQGIISPNA